MIKKKYIIAIVALMTVVAVNAQTMNFESEGFEEGIRQHLALDEGAPVLQAHTDTITSLNLSRLGITDISDVTCLPMLERLNLSSNQVTDLSPLLPLRNLHKLDLFDNNLEDINVLAFTSSDSMVVNVGLNYIDDFSYFFRPMDCQFTFIGMDSQQSKVDKYFHVYQLYAFYDDKSQPIVTYRGYTNMDNAASLTCGETSVSATMDGETYDVAVTCNQNTAQKVVLTNGVVRDSTYVIPASFHAVQPNETKIIGTGLPGNYRIDNAGAQYGTVVIDGTNLQYTAPDEQSPDVVAFSYYEGARFRGYGYVLAGLRMGDVNADGSVTFTDAVGIVNRILGSPSGNFIERAADVNRDTKVTITDAVGVVNIIKNNSSTSAPKMTAPAGDADDVVETE